VSCEKGNKVTNGESYELSLSKFNDREIDNQK